MMTPHSRCVVTVAKYVRSSLRLKVKRLLTFLAAILVSDGGHHCLEAAVHGFRFHVESHVSDIGRDDDGVSDAAAKIFLQRAHVRTFPKYIYKVGVALVRPL